MKRFLLYVFIILLLISISKDLAVNKQNDEGINENIPLHNSNMDFTIMHIKIEPRDTVLSVVEKINDDNIQKLNITQIITDFEKINPTVDPYHLQPDTFYYFPKYKQ